MLIFDRGDPDIVQPWLWLGDDYNGSSGDRRDRG
jgi:hypothetical protein